MRQTPAEVRCWILTGRARFNGERAAYVVVVAALTAGQRAAVVVADTDTPARRCPTW